MLGPQEQCATCGFLARRASQPETPAREWFEVYPEQRNNPVEGDLLVPLGLDNRTVKADFVCFRYAPAFPRAEVTADAISANSHAVWGALIEKRHCPM